METLNYNISMFSALLKLLVCMVFIYTYSEILFSPFCLNNTCVNLRFTSEFDSIERLGKGAFGHVFKAKEKLLNKYCAIKIVRCKE